MKSLNNKGVSLVELVVAIAILSIAGTMLYYGFVAASRTYGATTQLQMAEDVAQHLSEEFKTHSVDWLKTTYGSAFVSDEVDPLNAMNRTIIFKDIGCTYAIRPDNQYSDFYVDVKLTSKQTVANEEIRTTTYEQSKKQEAYYALADKVGTNTFIIPEVVNIYDGDRVVVREALNEYDAAVVSDLEGALVNKLQKINETNAMVAGPQASIDDFRAGFETIYAPLSGLYSDSTSDLKKITDIEIVEKNVGANVEYYYIVNTKYEFTFDVDLTITNAGVTSTQSLSSWLGTTTSIETAVSGATSVYSIERNGTKFTVKYSMPLDDATTGKYNAEGTFAGKISAKDADGNEILYMADGSGTDKVAYVYFVYTPFNIYRNVKDGTDFITNDEVNFKYTGAGKNIARAFFVLQDMKHAMEPTYDVVMKTCSVAAGVNFDTQLQVYTNSKKVIDDTTVASQNISKNNYLTNSFGESVFNFYDMEISIKDKSTADGGKVIATINTTKED